jgi:hypothetical protein
MTSIFESYLIASLFNMKGVGYVAGLVAVVAVLQTFKLYKKRSLAVSNKNGILLPPGPPPRWFWRNALPTS